MSLPDHIIYLFIKKIKEDLNSSEKLFLEMWMEESSSNRDSYFEFKRKWTAIHWSKKVTSINLPGDWIHMMEKRKRQQKMVLLRKWMVAASILIAFFIGYRLVNLQEKHEVLNFAERNCNVPILVLNTGQEIELGQLRDTIMENGLTVIRDSSNIYYSPVSLGDLDYIPIHELIVPKGGEYKITLSDGSRIMVNSDTRISYPAFFNDSTREVYLYGEAYFDVEHSEEFPFIVHTENLDVRVLGTSFNVSAFEDDKEVVVTLVEGKVEINDENRTSILNPSEQYIHSKETGTYIITTVNPEMYISWTKGIFWFNEMALEDVMKKLSRWFDLEYEFSDSSLRNIRYSGGFRKYDNYEDLLRIVGEIMDIDFEVYNGKIKITKK